VNFAASISSVTTISPIPHEHAAFQEPTGYFRASPKSSPIDNALICRTQRPAASTPAGNLGPASNMPVRELLRREPIEHSAED
jgi:hypothetical protein